MKGFGNNKVLGLAVGERGVTVCELSRAGGSVRAENRAEFTYPPGVSPDEPAALGKALREFLGAQRFGTRHAVVGLPLKWAVVKPKEVPPASAEALAALLRLQAERDFAMELQGLALEYAGEANPGAAGTVLLLAVPRKRVDAVVATVEAAGLTVDAVTLSAVALAEATGRAGGGEGAVLHVGSGTAELAVQHGGHPRVLRHLRAPLAASVATSLTAPSDSDAVPFAAPAPGAPAAPGGPAAGLTLELRQVLSLMPQNGTAGSGELTLWDGVGLGDAPREWADALGVSVREPSLASLGVSEPADGAGAGRFAPAVALGLMGLAGRVTPDLLHSRLVERKKSRVGRPVVWGAVVGCAVVLGIVFAVWDLAQKRRELEDLKTKLAEVQPGLKAAQETITRVSFAQQWYRQDPVFLACMRDLMVAFPDDTPIWATRLTLHDDGRGSLEGQVANNEASKAAMRRLQEGGRFTEVRPVTAAEAGRNAKDLMTFSITFKFNAAAPVVAPPADRPAAAHAGAPATRPAAGAVNTDATAALDSGVTDDARAVPAGERVN